MAFLSLHLTSGASVCIGSQNLPSVGSLAQTSTLVRITKHHVAGKADAGDRWGCGEQREHMVLTNPGCSKCGAPNLTSTPLHIRLPLLTPLAPDRMIPIDRITTCLECSSLGWEPSVCDSQHRLSCYPGGAVLRGCRGNSHPWNFLPGKLRMYSVLLKHAATVLFLPSLSESMTLDIISLSPCT